MKRKWLIEIEVIDNEGSEQSNEASDIALKKFLMEVLGELAFDIKKLEVKSQ